MANHKHLGLSTKQSRYGATLYLYHCAACKFSTPATRNPEAALKSFNKHERAMDDMEYVNGHRTALGYSPFATLGERELQEQLELIEQHAPYGNDPWHEMSTYQKQMAGKPECDCGASVIPGWTCGPRCATRGMKEKTCEE